MPQGVGHGFLGNVVEVRCRLVFRQLHWLWALQAALHAV
jgi:hypothetical protein